jgi:hypothetical protein
MLRLAGKASIRRRPVNSALGLALSNVGVTSYLCKMKHAGTDQAGRCSSGLRKTKATASNASSQISSAPRDLFAPWEAVAVQSVGGSAATRQTAPYGTSASGGGEWHRLRLFQRTCACSMLTVGRRTSSTVCAFSFRPAMPNPALNRSANGRPAWPRGRLGSSSAARPSRPAVVARLALR